MKIVEYVASCVFCTKCLVVVISEISRKMEGKTAIDSYVQVVSQSMFFAVHKKIGVAIVDIC